MHKNLKESELFLKQSNFNKYKETYPKRFYYSYWMKFEEYYREHGGTLDTIHEIYWEYEKTLYNGSKYCVKQFLKNFLAHIYHEEGLTVPDDPNQTVINKKNREEVIREWNKTLGIKT